MSAQVKNAILFLTDQLRKDFLGCYGNPTARTPNLDRIAHDGVQFERAYTQNPFCCPARASILTGTYPRTHGLWHNGIQFQAGCPTIGDILSPFNVHPGTVGKIHVNPWFGPAPPENYQESASYWQEHPEMADWNGPYVGFQDVRMTFGHVAYSTRAGHYGAYLSREFPEGPDLMSRDGALRDDGYVQTWRNAIPEEHHYNTWIADNTIDLIDSYGSDRFFLHVSFPDPHHPFSACEPYASMFDCVDMPESIPWSEDELAQMPPHYLKQHRGEPSFYDKAPPGFADEIDGDPLNEIKRQGYGMTTHVDTSIGRIVDHLQKQGLLDDTLLIFTADHGELLGDHGLLLKGPFFYQQLVNIPIIVRPPSSWRQTANSGTTASANNDLVAHVDIVPTILDAMGLEVPDYLPGQSLVPVLAGTGSGEASASGAAGAKPAGGAGAYTPRDAVLTEFRPFDCPNMKVIHEETRKLVYYEGETYGELFNLAEDPDEHHNLWDDAAYATEKVRLKERLLDELVATEAAWPLRGPWE